MVDVLVERWRVVPGWDFYQISDAGRIYSSYKGGRFLSQRLDKYGYPRAMLWTLEKQSFSTIHSLVALAFIGERPDNDKEKEEMVPVFEVVKPVEESAKEVPVKEVPSHVFMDKADKWLTRLAVMSLFLMLWGFGYSSFQRSQQINEIKASNAMLQIQVKNLEIFQDEASKLLRLEKILYDNKAYRDRLGAQLPNVAHKILSLASKHESTGVTPSLILGLISEESGFNPQAVSSVGAQGLVQVMPTTSAPYLRQLGYPVNETIMFQPEVNLEVAVALINDLHNSFMNRGYEDKLSFTYTLIAYGSGERSMQEARKNPAERMVYLGYAMKIQEHCARWKDLGF